MFGRTSLRALFDYRVELSAPRHPRGIAPETIIQGYLGDAQQFAQTAEQPIVARRDHDPSVRGLERLIRSRPRRWQASALVNLAGRHVVAHVKGGPRDAG